MLIFRLCVLEAVKKINGIFVFNLVEKRWLLIGLNKILV